MLDIKNTTYNFKVQNIDARIIRRSKFIDFNDNMYASSRPQKYNINEYNKLK